MNNLLALGSTNDTKPASTSGVSLGRTNGETIGHHIEFAMHRTGEQETRV
jgi:hypothetical protein